MRSTDDFTVVLEISGACGEGDVVADAVSAALKAGRKYIDSFDGGG